jgi:hypothetical protein
MDTLKSPIGISEDIGHMNIISTIYALTAMPSGTVDPLNPDTIAKRADSTMLKILITAMVDLSLAHNSPQPDPNEQSQGIFTNYMQFMDNVVGKWDSIGSASAGIKRLESINGVILMANRTKIIDPVYIRNHGTLTEYGLPVEKQQRKNYAFYEGYTRMHVDMELWPDSNRYAKTGIGVMFRVSDNIELYEADLADTFNMFRKPFLSGDSLNRRIIYRADDTILQKLDKDGLWVKGKDGNLNNESYYTGISPVRLPVGSLENAISSNSPFALPIERSVTEDPYGTLLDNAESNIFKVFPLSVNPDGTEDTLRNDGNPEVLLHHQRRLVEIDTNYFGKNVISDFDVVRMDTGSRKIFVQQNNGFSATITDTSEADNVAIQVRISKNGRQIFIGERILLVTKFFSAGAENGYNYNKEIAGHPIEVKLVDIESVKIAEIADRDSDNVFIYITKPENIEICKSSDPEDKWIDWEKQQMPISWSDYKKMMKDRESLLFYSDKNCNETVKIDIYLPFFLMRNVNRNISKTMRSFIRENIVCDFMKRKDNQIVLEPITNDIVPGTLSEVYNPSCVVKNENAWFKVEINGPEFKGANITWRSKKKLVKFVDGLSLEDAGSGNNVEVKGISTGEDTLEVYIEKYNGLKPSIAISVVEWKEVDLFTYIVKNQTGTDSAWTDDEVSNKIDTVNSILKQIGVKINCKKRDGPEKSKYYVITENDDIKELSHRNIGTGGLELYLVKEIIIKDNNLAAVNVINAGIVVPKMIEKKEASARELAHEIFHSARQSADEPHLVQVYDIYDKMKSYRYPISDSLGILTENMPQDFGTGYYRSDLKHTSLVKKILQYGYSGHNEAIDIPRGTVYGIAEKINRQDEYERRHVECGYLRVNERVLIHQK